MAESAGYNVVFEVSNNGSTGWEEPNGINSLEIGRDGNVADITDFAQNAGARRRLKLLEDLSCSISGFYDPADAGQAIIEGRFKDGAACHIGVKWLGDGDTREVCECIVTDFSISASPDGVVEFSASLSANGAKLT